MKEPIMTIGQIIDENAKRDAIHIAIAPVKATTVLSPGDRIDFASKDNRTDVVKVRRGGFGIVDPFLVDGVEPGQWFYAFLLPNTVTGMRHEWQHPAFAGVKVANAKEVARAAIDAIASQVGGEFDSAESLIEHVEACMDGGDCYLESNSEHMRNVWYEKEDEFWRNYEVLTGKKKPDDDPTIFSCSC